MLVVFESGTYKQVKNKRKNLNKRVDKHNKFSFHTGQALWQMKRSISDIFFFFLMIKDD